MNAHPQAALTDFSCGCLVKAHEAGVDGPKEEPGGQRRSDDTAGPSDPAGHLSGSPDFE